MKSIIGQVRKMPREDGKFLLIILAATLLGCLGTAVFLNWVIPAGSQLTGMQSFMVSLAATLVYSSLLGLVLALIHPQRGLLIRHQDFS